MERGLSDYRFAAAWRSSPERLQRDSRARERSRSSERQHHKRKRDGNSPKQPHPRRHSPLGSRSRSRSRSGSVGLLLGRCCLSPAVRRRFTSSISIGGAPSSSGNRNTRHVLPRGDSPLLGGVYDRNGGPRESEDERRHARAGSRERRDGGWSTGRGRDVGSRRRRSASKSGTNSFKTGEASERRGSSLEQSKSAGGSVSKRRMRERERSCSSTASSSQSGSSPESSPLLQNAASLSKRKSASYGGERHSRAHRRGPQQHGPHSQLVENKSPQVANVTDPGDVLHHSKAASASASVSASKWNSQRLHHQSDAAPNLRQAGQPQAASASAAPPDRSAWPLSDAGAGPSATGQLQLLGHKVKAEGCCNKTPGFLALFTGTRDECNGKQAGLGGTADLRRLQPTSDTGGGPAADRSTAALGRRPVPEGINFLSVDDESTDNLLATFRSSRGTGAAGGGAVSPRGPLGDADGDTANRGRCTDGKKGMMQQPPGTAPQLSKPQRGADMLELSLSRGPHVGRAHHHHDVGPVDLNLSLFSPKVEQVPAPCASSSSRSRGRKERRDEGTELGLSLGTSSRHRDDFARGGGLSLALPDAGAAAAGHLSLGLESFPRPPPQSDTRSPHSWRASLALSHQVPARAAAAAGASHSQTAEQQQGTTTTCVLQLQLGLGVQQQPRPGCYPAEGEAQGPQSHTRAELEAAEEAHALGGAAAAAAAGGGHCLGLGATAGGRSGDSERGSSSNSRVHHAAGRLPSAAGAALAEDVKFQVKREECARHAALPPSVAKEPASAGPSKGLVGSASAGNQTFHMPSHKEVEEEVRKIQEPISAVDNWRAAVNEGVFAQHLAAPSWALRKSAGALSSSTCEIEVESSPQVNWCASVGGIQTAHTQRDADSSSEALPKEQRPEANAPRSTSQRKVGDAPVPPLLPVPLIGILKRPRAAPQEELRPSSSPTAPPPSPGPIIINKSSAFPGVPVPLSAPAGVVQSLPPRDDSSVLERARASSKCAPWVAVSPCLPALEKPSSCPEPIGNHPRNKLPDDTSPELHQVAAQEAPSTETSVTGLPLLREAGGGGGGGGGALEGPKGLKDLGSLIRIVRRDYASQKRPLVEKARSVTEPGQKSAPSALPMKMMLQSAELSEVPGELRPLLREAPAVARPQEHRRQLSAQGVPGRPHQQLALSSGRVTQPLPVEDDMAVPRATGAEVQTRSERAGGEVRLGCDSFGISSGGRASVDDAHTAGMGGETRQHEGSPPTRENGDQDASRGGVATECVQKPHADGSRGMRQASDGDELEDGEVRAEAEEEGQGHLHSGEGLAQGEAEAEAETETERGGSPSGRGADGGGGGGEGGRRVSLVWKKAVKKPPRAPPAALLELVKVSAIFRSDKEKGVEMKEKEKGMELKEKEKEREAKEKKGREADETEKGVVEEEKTEKYEKRRPLEVAMGGTKGAPSETPLMGHQQQLQSGEALRGGESSKRPAGDVARQEQQRRAGSTPVPVKTDGVNAPAAAAGPASGTAEPPSSQSPAGRGSTSSGGRGEAASKPVTAAAAAAGDCRRRWDNVCEVPAAVPPTYSSAASAGAAAARAEELHRSVPPVASAPPPHMQQLKAPAGAPTGLPESRAAAAGRKPSRWQAALTPPIPPRRRFEEAPGRPGQMVPRHLAAATLLSVADVPPAVASCCLPQAFGHAVPTAAGSSIPASLGKWTIFTPGLDPPRLGAVDPPRGPGGVAPSLLGPQPATVQRQQGTLPQGTGSPPRILPRPAYLHPQPLPRPSSPRSPQPHLPVVAPSPRALATLPSLNGLTPRQMALSPAKELAFLGNRGEYQCEKKATGNFPATHVMGAGNACGAAEEQEEASNSSHSPQGATAAAQQGPEMAALAEEAATGQGMQVAPAGEWEGRARKYGAGTGTGAGAKGWGSRMSPVGKPMAEEQSKQQPQPAVAALHETRTEDEQAAAVQRAHAVVVLAEEEQQEEEEEEVAEVESPAAGIEKEVDPAMQQAAQVQLQGLTLEGKGDARAGADFVCDLCGKGRSLECGSWYAVCCGQAWTTCDCSKPARRRAWGKKKKQGGNEFTGVVHRLCAFWSSGVGMHQSKEGGFRFQKLIRVRQQSKSRRCAGCHKVGASLGCRVESCRTYYHFPCALALKLRMCDVVLKQDASHDWLPVACSRHAHVADICKHAQARSGPPAHVREAIQRCRKNRAPARVSVDQFGEKQRRALGGRAGPKERAPEDEHGGGGESEGGGSGGGAGNGGGGEGGDLRGAPHQAHSQGSGDGGGGSRRQVEDGGGVAAAFSQKGVGSASAADSTQLRAGVPRRQVSMSSCSLQQLRAAASSGGHQVERVVTQPPIRLRGGGRARARSRTTRTAVMLCDEEVAQACCRQAEAGSITCTSRVLTRDQLAGPAVPAGRKRRKLGYGGNIKFPVVLDDDDDDDDDDGVGKAGRAVHRGGHGNEDAAAEPQVLPPCIAVVCLSSDGEDGAATRRRRSPILPPAESGDDGVAVEVPGVPESEACGDRGSGNMDWDRGSSSYHEEVAADSADEDRQDHVTWRKAPACAKLGTVQEVHPVAELGAAGEFSENVPVSRSSQAGSPGASLQAAKKYGAPLAAARLCSSHPSGGGDSLATAGNRQGALEGEISSPRKGGHFGRRRLSYSSCGPSKRRPGTVSSGAGPNWTLRQQQQQGEAEPVTPLPLPPHPRQARRTPGPHLPEPERMVKQTRARSRTLPPPGMNPEVAQCCGLKSQLRTHSFPMPRPSDRQAVGGQPKSSTAHEMAEEDMEEENARMQVAAEEEEEEGLDPGHPRADDPPLYLGMRPLCPDISGGLERLPIPVTNDVDEEGVPRFTYIMENKYSDGISKGEPAPACGGCPANIDDPLEQVSSHVVASLLSWQCIQQADKLLSPAALRGKDMREDWEDEWMAGRLPYDTAGRLLLKKGFSIIECNERCPCYASCHNSQVQNGLRFRLELFKTLNKGWGVRTLERVARGEFVTAYVGEILTADEAGARGETQDRYLFEIDNRDVEAAARLTVDGINFSNIARFINHSCVGNLRVHMVYVDTLDPRHGRISLFAIRDIEAGEELTYDYEYKLTPEEDKGKTIACHCLSQSCRNKLWVG